MSTLSSANVTDVNLVLKERTHMRLCLNMLIFTHNLGNWLIVCCRQSMHTNADDVRERSDNISVTTTSANDAVPRTSHTSVGTSTNVYRNATDIIHSDTGPSLAVMRPATSPANQRTETVLTSVARENDNSGTVRPHSAVTHSVMPNTQRNSSQFTFANSTHRTTASNHRIANDAHPDKAKVSRSSSANFKQPSNKDSLPEFSVDFDVTASTFSGDVGASSSDFCASVTSSFNTRSASAGQNESNVSRTARCERSVNDSQSLMKNDFNRTSLEPLLGKERMQRLIQNLRDIELVSTPTPHHHHHHRHLSQSADKYQASRPTVNCWASTSATTYETRTAGLHETSSSVVDEGKTSVDLHEARMSVNEHKGITSSLGTSSGLQEKTCTAESFEMEEDDVNMTSSLGLLLHDCISSSSSMSQHVRDTRNTRDGECSGNVECSYQTRDVYRPAHRLYSSNDDDHDNDDDNDKGVADDERRSSPVRHHIDAITNMVQHRSVVSSLRLL